MKTIHLFICTLFLTTSAIARDIQVTWDPPAPEDTISLEGYNVYEILLDPPVAPPKPAAEANIPSPVAGSTAVYRKLNAEPIPAGTTEYVIKDARPGLQVIVRAYNFMGDSPDSDVLTIHDTPKKPSGLKAVALLIERSSNLKNWSPMAVIYGAADLTSSFFRLSLE